MNDQQSFDDARKDAMGEADSDARPLRFDSPNAIDARVGAGSSLILQVDKGLGKQFFVVLWLSAFVSAVALVAVVIGGLVLLQAYRNQTAHVNTLQYDLAQVKAQLIEKGLYEPTSH